MPQEGDTLRELRPLLVALALPTLALAFAISALTTYGPVVLIRLANSDTKVGLLIGGEGAFALFVPILAGVVSDRLPASPLGRRVPLVLLGVPFLVGGLVLLPYSPSYLLAAVIVFSIYVGYFLYYPPYRALYADLFPRSYYGRAQSSQAIARGLGLGAALLAGGLLLTVWRPFPFVLAAAFVVAATAFLLPVARLESSARADVRRGRRCCRGCATSSAIAISARSRSRTASGSSASPGCARSSSSTSSGASASPRRSPRG